MGYWAEIPLILHGVRNSLYPFGFKKFLSPKCFDKINFDSVRIRYVGPAKYDGGRPFLISLFWRIIWWRIDTFFTWVWVILRTSRIAFPQFIWGWIESSCKDSFLLISTSYMDKKISCLFIPTLRFIHINSLSLSLSLLCCRKYSYRNLQRYLQWSSPYNPRSNPHDSTSSSTTISYGFLTTWPNRRCKDSIWSIKFMTSISAPLWLLYSVKSRP